MFFCGLGGIISLRASKMRDRKSLDLIWNCRTITCIRQNTNHGSTKLAWHAMLISRRNVLQKGTIGLKTIVLLVWHLLRPCPHYTGEIWKHGFISGVQSTVHTNPSRKQSFWKHSLNRRNLKTTSLPFSADGKLFKNESFQKGWHHDNNVISLP